MRVVPGQKMIDPLTNGLIPRQQAIVFADAGNLIRDIVPGTNTHDFDLMEALKRP
jgi:hypothetical protein